MDLSVASYKIERLTAHMLVILVWSYCWPIVMTFRVLGNGQSFLNDSIVSWAWNICEITGWLRGRPDDSRVALSSSGMTLKAALLHYNTWAVQQEDAMCKSSPVCSWPMLSRSVISAEAHGRILMMKQADDVWSIGSSPILGPGAETPTTAWMGI